MLSSGAESGADGAALEYDTKIGSALSDSCLLCIYYGLMPNQAGFKSVNAQPERS